MLNLWRALLIDLLDLCTGKRKDLHQTVATKLDVEHCCLKYLFCIVSISLLYFAQFRKNSSESKRKHVKLQLLQTLKAGYSSSVWDGQKLKL